MQRRAAGAGRRVTTGTENKRIVVDAMGGDNAPDSVVAGAVLAAREHGVRPILVGHAPRIRELLAAHEAIGEIPIVNAEDVVGMDEGALAGLRRPRSSVAVACRVIRRGHASALVSAGSTGGVVATSRLRLRGQAGVTRPAIAVVLPTRPRPTVLLDAGATADAKPEMLVQFAMLGTAYARIRLGISSPQVGLLTIGEEAGKGNKLTRRAYELLAGEVEGVHFAGNVEGSRPAHRQGGRRGDGRLHRQRRAEDGRGDRTPRGRRDAGSGDGEPHRQVRRVAAEAATAAAEGSAGL